MPPVFTRLFADRLDRTAALHRRRGDRRHAARARHRPHRARRLPPGGAAAAATEVVTTARHRRRRRTSAGRPSTCCSARWPRPTAAPRSPSCSPAWARTASAAPSSCAAPAPRSSRRTRRPRSSGACPARSPTAGLADEVLPLDEIAAHVLISRHRRRPARATSHGGDPMTSDRPGVRLRQRPGPARERRSCSRPGKEYLVEARLLPLARQPGMPSVVGVRRPRAAAPRPGRSTGRSSTR